MKILLIAFVALSLAPSWLPAGEYQIISHYQVSGDASGFDYIRADSDTRRLYIAHDKRFDVLDADSGQRIGEIAPTARAHGVALIPELNRGFASSGADSKFMMFDLKTLTVIKTFKSSGSNPDAIEYDPESKHVFAGNHSSGEIVVIDPATGEIISTLPLGGKLEGIDFDSRGQGYVIAEDQSAVHVFNTHTLKAKATWTLAPGEGGTGLAVDPEHHRLFAACGNNKAVILDSDTGKLITTVPIGDDPDGLAFDPKKHRIFTSNSEGTITIIQQETADKYSVIQTVKTAPHCRTIGFDLKTGRVITCAPQHGPRPDGATASHPPIKPGALDVIVVGEK